MRPPWAMLAAGRRRGRGWAVLACLLCVLLLGACGSSSPTSSAAAKSGTSGKASASGKASSAPTTNGSADAIVIKNFMFAPMSLTVAPGATITVRNEDSVTHTLTDKSNSKLFSTGDVSAGQSKTFKAPAKAGTYSYICMIHQYMTGTIKVR